MKRKIIISSDHTSNIEIFDESDVDFNQYCENLSTIFKENNIIILKTTNSTTILRPSKIVGIEVKDIKELPLPLKPPSKRIIYEDIKLLKIENENNPIPLSSRILKEGDNPNKKENKNKKEDIITDVN